MVIQAWGLTRHGDTGRCTSWCQAEGMGTEPTCGTPGCPAQMCQFPVSEAENTETVSCDGIKPLPSIPSRSIFPGFQLHSQTA